jgi:RNA polymerase sigma factor (sigma-70 family)
MADSVAHVLPSERVFVVDDDDSTRRALVRLIAASGFAVADHRTADALLSALPGGACGCVVTDLRMPGMSGLELQRAARLTSPDLTFVFITGHGVVSDAVAALQDGAIDFLEKPVDPNRLLASIERALARSRAAFEHRERRDAAVARLARLTPRERQVCRLVGRGLLNKQIASDLGTSEKTVKTQRGRAMRKIQATSTADLVDLLRRAGDEA